jgi:hypothetical protein
MIFCFCLCESVQAEEEALMLQQYVASENTQEFESRVRPYVSQVLMVIFTDLHCIVVTIVCAGQFSR